jgi:two-component system sensor histidine kinase and response regulator WspE
VSALDALFRDEVEQRAHVLHDGLRRCEQAVPDGEMLFAAQALKGAARVVGVRKAERLADGLELLLGASESAGRLLTAAQRQACADALELIEAIAQSGAARADEVATEAQLADLLERLAVPAPVAAVTRRTRSPASVTAATRDLFRQECEQHTRAMSEGLLALEREPDQPALLDRLMRASHSVKGAARAVGLDSAVALAHAAEDQLERARRRQILVGPDLVDALLAASDLIQRIGVAVSSGGEPPADETLLGCAMRITQTGLASLVHPTGSEADGEGSAAAPRATRQAAEEDRVVRIRATQLSRLVALSGELVVETGRQGLLAAAQQRMRRQQAGIADLLDELQQSMAALPGGHAQRSRMDTLRKRLNDLRASNATWSDDFEQHARRKEDLSLRLYREALDSRLQPLSDGLGGFPRLVRDIARRLGKQAGLTVSGETHRIDRDILERIEAPLNHLLRNALDHGLEAPAVRRERGKPEQGRVSIDARVVSGLLEISVTDDGAGIDIDKVRARVVEKGLETADAARSLPQERLLDHLFVSGFSTADQVTEISGRGVGLAVVRSVMRDVGGSVSLHTMAGEGVRFELRMPISRSVLRAVVVSIAGEPHAFALTRVDRLVRLTPAEVLSAGNRRYFVVDGRTVSLVRACELLELGSGDPSDRQLDVVVVSDFGHSVGFIVDAVLSEQDMVLQPLDPRLGRVPDLSAAAVLPDGRPVLVLDAEDMVRSVLRAQGTQTSAHDAHPPASSARRLRVLVADDTATIREMERDLLARAGYEVMTAADGMEAWQLLQGTDVDLVMTDVDMPRLDGIGLIRSIRQDARLKALPVIVVSYRASASDRQQGLDAGATVYMTKADYEDSHLLDTVARLVGRP